MLRYCLLACGLALAASAPVPILAKNSSVVTDLHGKACSVIESDRRGASTRRCPGVAGFALLVHENEGRTSVDVVAPGKDVYQLDFWDVVTPGYSQVGRKAEWQLGAQKQPQALIVRIETRDEHTPYFRKAGSTLAVVRIDPDGACVVFKVDANAKRAQSEANQAAADRSRKCLGTYNVAAEAEKELAGEQ